MFPQILFSQKESVTIVTARQDRCFQSKLYFSASPPATFIMPNGRFNTVKTSYWTNAGTMLGQLCRRLANIVSKLDVGLAGFYTRMGNENEMNRALGHLCAHIG